MVKVKKKRDGGARGRRILALGMLFLTVLAALVLYACGEDGKKPEDPDSEPVPDLVMTAEDFRYEIMRPETNDANIRQAASALWRAISDNIGYKAEIRTDWVARGETPVIRDCEIILGNADRPEAEEALSQLSEGEYCVRVNGTKIVMIGADEYGTLMATKWFIKNYVEGKTVMRIPGDLNHKGTYESMYIYHLDAGTGASFYDQSVTLFCLQGIFNRESGSKLYIDKDGSGTKEWLTIMKEEGRWLSACGERQVGSLDDLLQLTQKYVKGVVIWDPAVPATLNLATTIAGVEDAVPMTGAQYRTYAKYYADLPVTDLRGKFDGSVTGSAKNDVYRWGIENYLAKGSCSKDYLCYYVDSALSRSGGDIAYVCLRDWAVYNRAFVYDLSPWGDEAPMDDPDQPVGCDLETYRQMLQTQYELTDGKQMTEVAGFFSFAKYSVYGRPESRHGDVATEWETVWLITPYNCYQNTATEFCYNQSFHTQYSLHELKQNEKPEKRELENKTYLAFLMADYDSAFPLYFYLPGYWNDPRRGELPLAWGINPNLSVPYPDLVSYFYETRTENDYFCADASAAGYFNPSRILEKHWDMVTEHNRRYYEKLDLSLSPMILDWGPLSTKVKEEFRKFSPDGIATIVCDFHNEGARPESRHVFEGMTVDSLYNGFDTSSSDAGAWSLHQGLPTTGKQTGPQFLLVRAVWTSPTLICESVEKLQKMCPGLDIEVVDMYTYFDLLGQALS